MKHLFTYFIVNNKSSLKIENLDIFIVEGTIPPPTPSPTIPTRPTIPTTTPPTEQPPVTIRPPDPTEQIQV